MIDVNLEIIKSDRTRNIYFELDEIPLIVKALQEFLDSDDKQEEVPTSCECDSTKIMCGEHPDPRKPQKDKHKPKKVKVIKKQEMNINSMLDIVKSVDDLKYLESKGFDTSELLDYFSGKIKKVDCKYCKYIISNECVDYCFFSGKISSFSMNRHGLCEHYKEIISECHKHKIQPTHGSLYRCAPICPEKGCFNVINIDGSINKELTEKYAKSRETKTSEIKEKQIKHWWHRMW